MQLTLMFNQDIDMCSMDCRWCSPTQPTRRCMRAYWSSTYSRESACLGSPEQNSSTQPAVFVASCVALGW